MMFGRQCVGLFIFAVEQQIADNTIRASAQRSDCPNRLARSLETRNRSIALSAKSIFQTPFKSGVIQHGMITERVWNRIYQCSDAFLSLSQRNPRTQQCGQVGPTNCSICCAEACSFIHNISIKRNSCSGIRTEPKADKNASC